MELKTRVFELCKGRYKNLSELAQAMGISVSQVYRVRKGDRPINEKFIMGAVKAFPEYNLDGLFYVAPQKGVRMSRDDLGKILKQRRIMIPLTLKELATRSGISTSHIGRIERGERFPSARILQRLAEPLGFEQTELFTLADYIKPSSGVETPGSERLDPYVASVLSQESVEIQRAVVTVLNVLKSMAKGA